MRHDPTVDSTNHLTTPRQIPVPNDVSPAAAPPAQSKGCRNLLLGCGCLIVLGFVIATAGSLWVMSNWRFLAAETGSLVIKTAIRELQIPAQQRRRIDRRLDQLAQQYADGDLSDEQLEHILKVISESPLLPAASALVVERQYLDDSGLDADEKETARREIQRFAYGSLDESISPDTVSAVLDTISERESPEGPRTFRQSLTDDELRDFVVAATEAADEAGVPAEVPEINFADEFDKAVDEALAPGTPNP
jgi:hypothetical protein